MSTSPSELLALVRRDPSGVDPGRIVERVRSGSLDPMTAGKILDEIVGNTETNPLSNLEPLLTDDDPEIRSSATVVVARVARNHPESVEPLLSILLENVDDPSDLVSTRTARTLSFVASTYPDSLASSLDSMVSRLKDTSTERREAIATVLYRVSEERPGELAEYANHLLDLIERLDRNERDHDAVLRQNRGNDVIVRELQEEEFSHDRIRVIAVRTLTNVAESSVDPGAVIDVDRVLGLSSSERHVRLRIEALDLLGTVAKRSPEEVRFAIPRVSELVVDGPDDVSGKAAWVLGVLAEEYPEAVTERIRPNVDSVLDLLDSESATTRGSAIGLLSYVATVHPAALQHATPRIVALLDSDHEFVRGGAVLTLESLDADGALDELERIAKNDPVPEIRRTANEAVRTLEE